LPEAAKSQEWPIICVELEENEVIFQLLRDLEG